MYIFYEHHRDAYGKIVLTELKVSTFSDRWKINFFDAREKMKFEFIKKALKITPVASRSYDEATNIWSYFPPYGKSTLKACETVTAAVGGVILQEVTGLADVVNAGGSFDFSKQPKNVPKPEDFFYQQAAQQAKPVMTKELASKQLKEIMQLNGILVEGELTKKHYRQAALKLHPDRINDKGAAMADLNVLWGVYNA